MARESARQPRRSRTDKAPFQQAELLSNQKEVAGGPEQQVAQRTSELAEANQKLSKEIGERREIEKRLQQNESVMQKAFDEITRSETKLRQVIDTIPALAWCNLPDGSNEFLNRRWHEYTGLSPEESHGWGWQVAFHPEDLPALMKRWREMLISGEPGEIEARLRRYDGVYRWFLIRAEPLHDETGEIVRWYGTSTDIEDRKRAEEALQASELTTRLIVDSIPGLVVRMTAAGEVEAVNRQLLEYFGKSLEDIRSWTTSGIVHPEDLARAIEIASHSFATGDPYEMEIRFRRFDGVFRWFQARGLSVRDAEERILHWYALHTDIDDRKQAEAQVEQAYLRLAEAQRLSKTGSFITDLLVDEHNWSEEAFRIFEFDPATKVTVQMIRDMVHPEDLASFDTVITRGMQGIDVDFVFRIVTSRGALKHIRGMARVMEQIAGRPLFIGALQDVTESKLAEGALNKARSELARVARATTLNALTASIAHEVNQPLSGIITNASTCLRMLNGDPPNIEGARETVRRTIRDGNRASDVITRLRSLFSKKELTSEPLDLNDATREVIALSLGDLQRNRVILRSELADDLPPVSGDRVQLQQVILNLVRNASEAMTAVEDRPRQLLIRTEKDGCERVRLTVKDEGVGFDAQAADSLFQPFYTTKDDGMGIGLSVSRAIIEAHRGRLWAVPNEGPGATFSFLVPCRTETKVQ